MNDNFVHFNMVAYAHEKEGLRQQAEFYNFGWFTGADDHHDEIISKTSCGSSLGWSQPSEKLSQWLPSAHDSGCPPNQRPQWVICRHSQGQSGSPLTLRKRTSETRTVMSALGQQRKLRLIAAVHHQGRQSGGTGGHGERVE
jgi:hypothetical protein